MYTFGFRVDSEAIFYDGFFAVDLGWFGCDCSGVGFGLFGDVSKGDHPSINK